MEKKVLTHLKEHKFIIQVKHSRRGITRFAKAIVEKQSILGAFQPFEKQKGRQESRELELYEVPTDLQEQYTIQRVILVKRRRTLADQIGKLEYNYYVSNLQVNDPSIFYDLIRRHWWVENKLHWVKDVIYREDQTKFHNYDTFKKNAWYKNISLSAIREAGWTSVKAGLEWLANQPTQIAPLLGLRFRT